MSIEKNIEFMDDTLYGYHAAFRLWAIREMLAHRGFTQGQIADEMGISRNWVSQILTGAAYPKVNNFHKLLDQVETAITDLTKARGYMCTCSKSTHAELAAILELSSATRELSE